MMSIYPGNFVVQIRPLLGLFIGLLLINIVDASPAKAFQVRQADSLRIMQSQPYAASANFRVNADMFIQPSKTIRSADLVTQAAAPTPSTPPAPSTPTSPSAPSSSSSTSSGGGGSSAGGGYDHSNWLLSRKYDELVQDREEQDGSFLTSATTDPALRFDYVPTDPDLVETLEEEPFLLPQNEAKTEIDDFETNQPDQSSGETEFFTPEATNTVVNPLPPVRNLAPPTFDQTVFAPEPVSVPGKNNYISSSSEQVLIGTPPNPEAFMVVPLTSKQKNTLMKAQADGFAWPWTNRSKTVFEDWQSAAPIQSTETKGVCLECEKVLWWTWCQFVILALLLILFLLLLNTTLQIFIFRCLKNRFKPDNPTSFTYRMKKFLQSIGLLSVMMFVTPTLVTQAQTTTSPQALIYEGELLDDLGDPAVGSFTFRFSFWDNADYETADVTGGVLNTGATDYRGWTEVQTTSTIADGSFSLQLGDVTPFIAGLFDQDNLYLQVEVKNAGDPDSAYEFVDIDLGDNTIDRKIIASVPFAFNANKLDYRDLGFGSGNIPYLDLTGLLPESVIPDLNLQADDLDLTDITLSDFTNDLALNDGQVMIGDGTNTATPVTISGDGTLDNTGIFTLAVNSVGEDELDFGAVTLTDFTNDAGFVTTDNDVLGALACAANEIAKWDGTTWVCAADAGGTSYTASNGITLTGSNFTSDLGTDIETAEIQDDAVTPAKLGGAGADQVLTSDALGNPQWEDRSNFAVSALSTDNIFIGDGAGDATESAVSGDLTMTGGNFQIVAGSVTSAEIATGAVGSAEIADNSITSLDIAPDAITSTELADNAVDTAAVVDDAITDEKIDLTDVTLADFTNDAGFITTDNDDQTLSLVGTDLTIANGNTVDLASIDTDTDTTYTAGTGLTLTGTTFSNDLGTDIDDTELDFGSVTLADFTNDAGFLTTADISDNTNLTAGTGATLTDDTLSVNLGDTVEGSEITDGTITNVDLDLSDITLATFTNDAGFITTDTDTTYTAGSGLTLTGTTFSNDLGNSIAKSEMETNAVGDDALDYTEVTLNDFSNDAGYLTTVDISDDTNLAVGSGLTQIGDSIIADLGSEITSGEIVDGTITDSDLNLSNVTLNDFTNDTGFLTTVDVSDDTNLVAGTGLTQVNDTLSVNLGDSIDVTELEINAVGDDALDYSQVTLTDFTNDAGYLTIDSDTLKDLSCGINEITKWNGAAWVCAADAGGTTFSAADGISLTGSVFTNDFSTSIESSEITDGTIEDQDINLTDVTVSDFTNDAGYVTFDTLEDLSCSAGEVARWDGAAWVCAGSPTAITEILSPRYPNSAFVADGTNNTGSMYEEDETATAGFLGTIIRWFSRQVGLHDYDVIVEWTVPDDFDNLQDPGLSLDYKTEGTVSDAAIDMIVQQNNSGIDELTAAGMSLNSNSWTTTDFTLNAGTTWNAGDVMKIRLRLKARQSNSVSIGNIKINYNRK